MPDNTFTDMATTRRVTFGLYPTRQQETQRHDWRQMHCLLYNAAIANRKTQYERFGKSVDYFEQQNGDTADRDVAAAQVMLNWARGTERASLDADVFSSDAVPTYCGGLHKLGPMKRQKLNVPFGKQATTK